MRYENITRGIFIDRPNRFLAHVKIDGIVETVHVKNTGRCRELLVSGAEVYLTEPDTPGRKTRYDLVAVRKSNGIYAIRGPRGIPNSLSAALKK